MSPLTSAGYYLIPNHRKADYARAENLLSSYIRPWAEAPPIERVKIACELAAGNIDEEHAVSWLYEVASRRLLGEWS